jgi:bifunctional polynucleotide phosphatase/kinase
VYILDSPNLPGSSKIVGFDMDSTLIEPKSGRKFPVNEQDWKWLFPEVPAKLKELYNTGHKIVIFTNQNGISKGNQDVNHLKKKILAMINEIQVPIQVFMASAEDEYRKPSTEMWHLMLRAHNHGVQPDVAQCLYVGDAAGRPATAKRSKDFSAGDRKFAFNLKIGFKTETEFFLNVPPEEFAWDTFDVTAMPVASSAEVQEKYTAEGQEMVLMIGQPASGKSTFTKRHFASYARVNQDTLLSKAKCWQEARNQLSAGRSVVVDNTNPSREARKVYLDMARELNVPVRCFVFKTDDKLAQHLNAFRERTQGVKKIPKIAYAMFKKQYEEPVASEGFKEIKFVPFTLKFDTPQEAELFKQFS